MVLSGAFEFWKKFNVEIIEHEADNIELPRLMRDIRNLGENKKENPFHLPYSIKARTLLHAYLSRMDVGSERLERGICLAYASPIEPFRPNIHDRESSAVVGRVSTCSYSNGDPTSNVPSTNLTDSWKCAEALPYVRSSIVASEQPSSSASSYNRAKHSLPNEGIVVLHPKKLTLVI